ncbi:MAG: LacI family DNA-binding transcriptional regulator [Actinobacteria bacterium]|nr:LacI family DNA-binding transcriptional regulator [Actinomycetota bacterium]
MNRRTTIVDIAKELGISPTTVNKALNGKPKVSKEMRQLIIDKANELNYRPNKLAQCLARKTLTIGVSTQRRPLEFCNYVNNGFNKALSDLSDYNVKGIMIYVEDFYSINESRNALNKLYSKDINGLIIVPGFGINQYSDLLDNFIFKGIPVLSVITEPVSSIGIGYLRLNGHVAGKMAAQFLSWCVHDKRQVVVLTQNKELTIHRECINGFIEEGKRLKLNMKGVYETQNDNNIAFLITEKLLNENPDLGGIYVSSYNSVGVCKCLEKYNKVDDVKVIGQDLYPELVECLKNGSLDATLFQDPFKQGYDAVKKMFSYLTEKQERLGDIFVVPQLVMTSNLECYKEKY